jgi:hypothetical protein
MGALDCPDRPSGNGGVTILRSRRGERPLGGLSGLPLPRSLGGREPDGKRGDTAPGEDHAHAEYDELWAEERAPHAATDESPAW